jgi:hypothetical protein
VKSFLEILADEILSKHIEKLSQICIVFLPEEPGFSLKKFYQ